ncbi:MAG TPA: hypothetical protein VHH36_05850 [Candidatus Thermoplasmatota archaeon]|nr:hypothetical protein [Candidatus Thermoplasmatota archaeon]
MKAAGVGAAVILAATLAGCAQDANPHLIAPKLVLAPLEDGNLTLYVHGAFQDRMYDRIELSIDNQTPIVREDAFSLETRLPASGFFLRVTAWAAESRYEARARVDVDAADERVVIAELDEDAQWASPSSYALPHERVIGRVAP